MADEIKLKAPTVEQQVVVNINGEEKLRSFADTLEKISNNKNLQKYWKTQQELINATADAYGNFSKKASQDNAKELIKVTNALKAMSGTDLSNILPDFDKISKAMAEAQKVAGNIDSAFSVKGFKEAFDSFETLRAYGVDIQNLFSHFGVSTDVGELQKNVRALEDEVEKLTRRLANAKNANEELRNEFDNFKSGSGFADKLDELDNLKSEMSYLREQAEETFRQFLKLNNITEDGYDRDGFYDDNRFKEYFQNIQSGYLSASDAIQQFKREYSYLLDDSFKSNNDTFGLEQLQAFSNKLDSIFRQVEETSTKINDIISNGVITKSVENLSMDSSLSDSQRSLFGNLLQDEESLKSITTLFQKLIEESNKTSKVDLFNDEQLQQVLSIFDKMEKHLSSLRSIISDVGDGEEFSPLLKALNDIKEVASNIKLNFNMDLGDEVSERLNQKVSQASARQLEAYRKLFSAMKGTGKTNKEMLKFFEPDEASVTELIGTYKGIIERAEKQFKVGNSNIYKKYLGAEYDALKREITNANKQLSRADSKRSENGILGDLFGNTKDLSEVIEQLNKIIFKLDEISSSASEFKNVFKEGFNVTASVEEIDKLTNRVKELEDELSKIKLNPVNVDKSNISSANSLSKMIKDWSEADKFLSSNGHKNSERFALFNAKTGYTSNQHLYDKADEISGELNLALIKQMEEAGQEITGAIHSHNDTNVASFSVEDLRVALNLLDRGITQHLVLAQNELMSLDMTKVNTNDFSKMVEKLESAYEELNQELLNGLHGQANIIIEQAEKQIGGSIIKDTLSGSLDNALNKNGVFEKLPKELIDELYRIAKTASENIKYELGNDDGLSQIGKTFLSYFDFDSYLQDDSISSDTKKAIETLKNNINTATISEFDRLSNRLDFSGLVPEDVLQSEMQHLIKMAFKNMGLSDALKIQSVDNYIKENPPIKDVFQGGKIEQATTSAKELDKTLEQVDIPTDSFDDVLSKLDLTESKLKEIVKITKQSVSDSEGKFHDSYTLKDKRGSTEIYGLSSNTEKGQLLRSNIVGYDAKEIEQEAKALNQAWEEANKVNNALNETKNTLSSLPRMTELDTQFSSLDAKLSSLNSELTSGRISVADYKKEVKSLTSEYSKLVTIQQNRDVETYKQNVKAAEQEVKAIERMNNELKSYNNQIPKKPVDGEMSDYFKGFVQNYKNAINEAQKYLDNLGDSPVTEEVKRKWKELTDVIENAKKEMDAVPNADRGSDSLSRRKEIDTITKYLEKFTGISKQAKQELKGLVDQLQSGDPSVNVKKIHDRFLEITDAERMAGREAKSFFDIFKSKVLHRLASQLAMYYLSFYDFIRYARNAITAVKELDTALIDLKKTTTMSSSELEQFYYDSNKVAKQLGVTTSEIIEQASAWSRLGYSSKAAATQMAELSSQFASISPGMSTDDAQEGLVSIMKAWDISTEQVEREVMDNINILGKIIAQTYSNVWCYFMIA